MLEVSATVPQSGGHRTHSEARLDCVIQDSHTSANRELRSILVALALLAACAGAKEAGPKQAVPAEAPGKESVPKVADKKEKEPQGPQDYASLYWPAAKPFVNSPVVSVSATGQRTVEQFQFPEAVRSAFEAAERAFGARNFPEGERRYREVIEACPTCYPALIGLGDCELGQRKARDAIEHYREAEQLNPDDFLAFFSEADAIARLGNFGEARELLTRALVLRPARATVLILLHRIEERIGAIVDDQPLRPKTAFIRDNELVTVAREGDPAAIWWGVYAMCKRIPTPEQVPGEGRTVSPQRSWNSQQEEVCLRKTASAYAKERSAKGSDPALERFLAADAAGLAKGFVLYEVASRLDPQIVLEVPLEQRKLVDRYVRTIVVRDRGH
ncbi:MAG: tetratricopeptide repeat protein [Deltaproteobacteria bacterium]|nr:MAG: tetratricopeptide repeat protein [Deltaproteobacteria bacterium]